MSINHETLAARLRRAYSQGAVPPLRDGLEASDANSAYIVQDINTRFWEQGGRRIVGRKIGLTAKAVQAQLGVDVPDYGVLFEDMEVLNEGTLPVSKTIQPKVEAEVALILGRDLNLSDPTPDDIADATDYAVAAIEIVDSRIADWKITYADTVADNGSSGYFVLGKEHKKLSNLDLYACGMALEVNGEVRSVGAGAACLGHPLKAAAWLARTMNSLGIGLKAGDILLTGALGPMVSMTPGDDVRAVIGGLGAVSFTYQDDRRP